ncbi:MAG: hypothetical protein A2Y07_06085 [Planctomycetes bacterium GWF2_50_10]|nr:MAG: hypothetical protein A2Y07_06085 [Planctomycetes bacterium GWF2_50_10]
MAIDANVLIMGAEKIDLLGRVVTLTKAQTTFNMAGGQMVETAYIDAELVPQKSVTPAMGFNIELVACDKTFALSNNDVVDFIDKSMVPCPVSLKNATAAGSVKYTIVSKSGSKLSFPVTSAQAVTSAGAQTILTVTRQTPKPGAKLPYTGSDTNALKALKPSVYVQSDYKDIKLLADKAVAGATDAATAAANIEKFVRTYISEKNYSVGYASATEVAQSRQGDCTEHAVLMTAICQAAGIPAKVAFGLLYVDEFGSRKDVFVGHAWTQCLIGDKWVDFDATRHAVGPTRITMGTGNGDPEQFFSMVAIFGNFTIASAEVK